MIFTSKICFQLSVLLMVACLVMSGCDYKRKEDIEKKYQKVLWGDEIDTVDYVQGIISLFHLDIFNWLVQELIEIVGLIPVQLVEELGDDPISILINLIENEGELDTGSGLKIRGGIATYKCKGCTDNCCFYDCGNWLDIPCSTCSKERCGQTCVSLPNSHQPYLAIGEI
eukprot:TRINITY_DN1690_c0_g1_i7.p2 TRINITY_DN1690_c0_g1~~TRINITY_DN1690_c0_g1_i7.p2  ORF type:complete len:170 (-),score=12.56 TRINITY_DN1690_c0_g1_i7:309-818(-)